MHVAVFAVRVALGALLILSGLLKVGQRDWPDTARQFGAPDWVVPVLPWVEVGVGIGVGAQLWPAAAVALFLLVVFTVLAGRQLQRGNRVPCGCFGALSRRPISGAMLARNVVLCVMAAVALL